MGLDTATRITKSLVSTSATIAAKKPNPMLPGSKYRVHDMTRPQPRVVTPGEKPGDPPSDAVILFDGTDLSKLVGKKNGPATWKIENGYMEAVKKSGSIRTKDSFGD